MATYAMLMLDAVNEGTNAERWVDELRVLAGAVERYPNVVLAVYVAPSSSTPWSAMRTGSRRLSITGSPRPPARPSTDTRSEYNLERLDVSGLNPEYGNPLFLKLACEALATLGETRFTSGHRGPGRRVQRVRGGSQQAPRRATRCDYDETTNLVQAVCARACGPGTRPVRARRCTTHHRVAAAGPYVVQEPPAGPPP